MAFLYLLVLLILAKIVLIDSPVGSALGDAIRNLVPPRSKGGAGGAGGAVSRSELEALRRDVEELRDRVDRIAEEQSFLTQVLSRPRPLRIGPGEGDE
jgi:hypothetical protein